ncbi:F-box/kelch-repeat protein At3g23880-like [Apium graveolens]|uniref:F-box/kelch-repeat protein At3g23880-like n=1 Tax=Apium graveolens TaxID=4045 RepID=UPI003D7B7AD8
MSSYYIPEDIIFKILLLLPAKSLLRFTAVCKLWQSIISNPQFIYTHLANSRNKQARVGILATRVDSCSSIDIIDHEELITKIPLPPQCHRMIRYARTSSCNGLVCLDNGNSDILHVWNPLTRQFKKISIPKGECSFTRCAFALGFGYDSISDDYKILRMVKFGHGVIEAQLFSFNTDCWKKIQIPKTIQSLLGLYSNFDWVQFRTGVFYMDGSNELISLDLHNEVFGVHPYPLQHKKRSHALNFQDSVAMIFESIGDAAVTLWTLDDFGGGKMSWIKSLKLEANPKINWVYFVLGVGQILAHDMDIGCFFYDYKKQTTKEVCKDISMISAFKYTESLVSLKWFGKKQ